MKPSDLLLGLRDLFGFLVPGAIFLVCLPQWLVLGAGGLFPGGARLAGSETLTLMVFFSLAYGLGAMLSILGSALDSLADRRLKADAPLDPSTAPVEAVVAHNLKTLAAALEADALARLPVGFDRPIWGKRAFWWNYLRVHCPAAVSEVDRLEAQQKLFRSLVAAGAVLIALEAIGVLLTDADVRVAAARAGVFAAVAAGSFVAYRGLRARLSERLFQLAVVQHVSDCLWQSPAGAGQVPPAPASQA